MTICMYDQYDKIAREDAARTYQQHPDFPAIEREALVRGFRKATIAEINASVNSTPWAVELHSWRGGLWIKLEDF